MQPTDANATREVIMKVIYFIKINDCKPRRFVQRKKEINITLTSCAVTCKFPTDVWYVIRQRLIELDAARPSTVEYNCGPCSSHL